MLYQLKIKKNNTLPIIAIEKYINKFIDFAIKNPQYIFLVTPIGTGLAGYNHSDIAPLFKDALPIDNIKLPKEFLNIIDK
jgi:hypothetical protein